VLLSQTELRREIETLDAVIEPHRRPNQTKWFRPGSGWFTPSVLRTANELGYSVALGNIYPHDPQFEDPQRNADFILQRVHEGSIIIIHDRPATPELLNIGSLNFFLE
jgi:peptidoglycan/xylan/chitin deacetylase (PgdA/CDA1 family)